MPVAGAAGRGRRPTRPRRRHLALVGWAWPALFPGGVTSGPEEERGLGAQPATNNTPAKTLANRPDRRSRRRDVLIVLSRPEAMCPEASRAVRVPSTGRSLPNRSRLGGPASAGPARGPGVVAAVVPNLGRRSSREHADDQGVRVAWPQPACSARRRSSSARRSAPLGWPSRFAGRRHVRAGPFGHFVALEEQHQRGDHHEHGDDEEEVLASHGCTGKGMARQRRAWAAVHPSPAKSRSCAGGRRAAQGKDPGGLLRVGAPRPRPPGPRGPPTGQRGRA